MGFEVSAQEVADTSGFERTGRLEVFELEEDAAVVELAKGNKCGCNVAYQPAALDKAADSINGVSTHGFGSSACSISAILICESDLTLNNFTRR